MDNEKIYTYCSLLLMKRRSPYAYICDPGLTVKPGDMVVVPFMADNHEEAALVLDVNKYTEYAAPYPIERSKHVLRIFGENESEKLQQQKKILESENADRIKTESQIEKRAVKESLKKNAVGAEKIAAGKEKMQRLLQSVREKSEGIYDIIADLSDGLILSADRKTITGYKTKNNKLWVTIRIPEGVEKIEDNAFSGVKISQLYIPKGLRCLGKHTIYDPFDLGPYDIYPKYIRKIEVEEGNPCFMSDGAGFYSIENGKKTLLTLYDKHLTEYIVPADVTSLAPDSFAHCPQLMRIELTEGVETFDMAALSVDTDVKEVFLSKYVKHFRALYTDDRESSIRDRVSYRIDEDSEYLFRDEDSIYEVLDDGSYKLDFCLYRGKGKVLLLEGTSVIGADAFAKNNGLTKIEFPESVKVIEDEAFAFTSLKSVVINGNIKRIEQWAFGGCEELKSVQLGTGVEFVAKNAFLDCSQLRKIQSEDNSFTYKEGIIERTTPKNSEVHAGSGGGPAYAWMNGKIFVHTGLSAPEEREFEELVSANGGTVKSSTVLNTDYLVYNADYDHETTKLRRARELKTQGKDIKIVDMEAWKSLLAEDASGDPARDDKKDDFANAAKKIVYVTMKEWTSAGNKAIYDEKDRKVYVTMAFDQRDPSAEVVKERVACAETLKENDPVDIVIRGDEWEVRSKQGQSLGVIGWSVVEHFIPYLNSITVGNGAVEYIMPRSRRTDNKRFAKGSVRFEIAERIGSEDSATDEDATIRKQFVYSVNDKEAHLIRWIGDKSVKTAVIPAVIEGKPVTSIDSRLLLRDRWTIDVSQFETIIISEGIKRLEAGLFYRVKGVKKYVFPASLEYISPDVFSEGEYRDTYLERETVYVAPAGSYAEKFLKAYKPVHYDVSSLFVVNADLEGSDLDRRMMPAFDFENAKDGLTAKFKKDYLLKGFKEKSVSIPDMVYGKPLKSFDVSEIPNFVEELSIPANVTRLQNIHEGYLFYQNGRALRKVTVAEDNSVYRCDGSAVFSKDGKTLLRFMAFSEKQYSVPEGTETLAPNSFAGMKNLESLILPESVRSIGKYAFGSCIKLSDIQGFERVPEKHEKVFTRDGFTFDKVPFEQKLTVVKSGNALIKYDALADREINVPDGITSIGDKAFGWPNDYDRVEVINLPSSVKTIGKDAFRGRKNLLRVNIPEGVTKVQSGTFESCVRLESIYIPASVDSIDLRAFPRYKPATLYSREETCALRSIEVDPTNTRYCSVDGMLLTKDRSEILFIPDVVQQSGFKIPPDVRKIGDSLFAESNILTELKLPDGITSIGREAFYHCKNLEKIVLPAELESIDKYAFTGCGKLKNIVLPAKLKRIEEAAFEDTGLSGIHLPESLEHIGEKAFANTEIKFVVIPKSVKTLGWGAFSCVPEIEVFDTIDPDAKDAGLAIDTLNGNPNSLVGYVGIGPAHAMWQCAANHTWVNYTIVVRSAETGEIKYKVWMGAEGTQRQYYCFLSSAWGHNATFAFEKLDEIFSKIRGQDHKLKVAKYRLEYPVDLSETAKSQYETYVKKHS